MPELGIMLAIVSAMGANVAFLCKHRGANEAPAVRFSHPLRSAIALFASRWWMLGWLVGAVAWGFHVAAMAVAPLSLVQAVMAGGLALLVLPAQAWFRIRLGWREWCGLGLSAGGLALLAVTADASHAHSAYSLAGLIAFEGSAVALGVTLLLPGTSGRLRGHDGVVLGVAAGVMVGVGNIAIKALSGTVPGDPFSLVSPWLLVAVGAGIAGFFSLARGLQLGAPIQVIALSSIAANVAAIGGGVLVFGDPIGSGALDVVVRSAAFVAVIAAAALMPTPRVPPPAVAGQSA
jgi:drug/metabolite transporter (DMT)-like permease